MLAGARASPRPSPDHPALPRCCSWTAGPARAPHPPPPVTRPATPFTHPTPIPRARRHTSNITRHLHDHHAPCGAAPEARTGVYALVVVRRPGDGRFLVTQVTGVTAHPSAAPRARTCSLPDASCISARRITTCHPLTTTHTPPRRPTHPQEFAGSGFWIPGGGVDQGEALAAAAVREAAEEAGVAVRVTGVLACEAHGGGAWRRVILYGEPAAAGRKGGDAGGEGAAAGGGGGDATVVGAAGGGGSSSGSNCGGGPAAAGIISAGATAGDARRQVASSLPAAADSPKTVPDFESAGACWVAAEQLPHLPLRSPGEMEWVTRVAAGLRPAPLALSPEWEAVFAPFKLV